MKRQSSMIFACLILSAFSATVLMADLTEGLVAYWPLDGDAKDAVGGNHGALLDGAKFMEDPEKGTVLSVDGIKAHIEVPHSDSIAFIDDTTLTISVWVKPASLPRTNWTTVLAKNRDIHYNNAYGIWISTSNRWHFRVGSTSSDGSATATGEWHHLAMRHDPTTTTLQGFLDGVKIYENTSAAPGEIGDSTLWIGGAGGVSEFYPGLIADVAIYNRALTPDEIQELASGANILTAVEPAAKLTATWGGIRK